MITALTTDVVPEPGPEPGLEPGQVAEFAFSKHQDGALRGAGAGTSANAG